MPTATPHDGWWKGSTHHYPTNSPTDKPTPQPTDKPTKTMWWSEGWHKHTLNPTENPTTMPTDKPTGWWNDMSGSTSGSVWDKTWSSDSGNWYTTTNAPNHQCETSFAYDETDGTCFDNWGFSRWGWSLGPFDDSTFAGNVSLSYDVWSGAGRCQISRGTNVGELTVDYDIDDDFYQVSWIVDAPFKFTGFHLHIGSEPLPRDRNGDYTVAPGQYEHVIDLNGVEVESRTINGTMATPFYIVAHADVCGLPENFN